MTESLERRIRHDPVGDDLADGEQPLGSNVPREEGLEPSREADDLEQDPDAVHNRVQEPEPPRPEPVGPWDDENLED